MLSKVQIREFWEQVICEKDDECWLWDGDVNPMGGIPEFAYRPQPGVVLSQKARGLAYQLANGWKSIPMGSYVYAICGNSLCVNPAHLKLGHTIVNADGLTKAQQRAFECFQGNERRNAKE